MQHVSSVGHAALGNELAIVRTRLIGAVEAEQNGRNSGWEANNRLVGVVTPANSHVRALSGLLDAPAGGLLDGEGVDTIPIG